MRYLRKLREKLWKILKKKIMEDQNGNVKRNLEKLNNSRKIEENKARKNKSKLYKILWNFERNKRKFEII